MKFRSSEEQEHKVVCPRKNTFNFMLTYSLLNLSES